jgi:hypothetical protein
MKLRGRKFPRLGINPKAKSSSHLKVTEFLGLVIVRAKGIANPLWLPSMVTVLIA